MILPPVALSAGDSGLDTEPCFSTSYSSTCLSGSVLGRLLAMILHERNEARPMEHGGAGPQMRLQMVLVCSNSPLATSAGTLINRRHHFPPSRPLADGQGASYGLGFETRAILRAALLKQTWKGGCGKELDAERSAAANERRRSDAISACPSEAIQRTGAAELREADARRSWALGASCKSKSFHHLI
jgi:hypothetical protein